MHRVHEPTDADFLCAHIESSTAWEQAQTSYETSDDFVVKDVELTSVVYLRGVPARECPRLRLSLTVEFDALDDSAADVQRQLIAELRAYLDRVESRLL